MKKERVIFLALRKAIFLSFRFKSSHGRQQVSMSSNCTYNVTIKCWNEEKYRSNGQTMTHVPQLLTMTY